MITYNKLRKDFATTLQDVRTRSYAVVAFTLLTIIILIAFAIRPILFKLSDEQGQYNALSVQNQEIEQNITTLVSLEDIYTTVVQGKDDALTSALPLTPETGPLFANIYAIASPHKVTVNSIKFTQSTSDTTSLHLGVYHDLPVVPHTQELYFQMSGVGAFSDVTNFVNDLENYPRVFNFLDIAFTGSAPASGVSTPQQDSFSLSGYVYYLPHP